jgi:lipopolysaccharide exporter
MNEVAAVLPGIAATVACAAAGLGAAAIVAGFLVQSVVSTGQAIYWRRPPWPRLRLARAREIISFGAPTSGASLLYTAQRNAGLAVLSASLAPAQAGFYWRAAQLGIEYQGKISGILLRLLFPLLSRARTHADLRVVRARVVRVHAAVIFPLLALLIALAPALVPLLYGDRWAAAAAPAQILAIAGFAAVIGTGTGPLLMAAGHPRALLAYNGASLVLLVGALLLAAPHGLIAACWAIVAVRLVNLVGTQFLLVQRFVGIPLVETLVHDVAPAGVAAAALVAVCLPLRRLLESADVPRVAVVAIAAAAGLAAYGLAMRLGFPRTWGDVRLLFERLVARAPRLAEAVD